MMTLLNLLVRYLLLIADTVHSIKERVINMTKVIGNSKEGENED